MFGISDSNMENEVLKKGKKTKWVRIPFDAVSLESKEEKQRYEKPFEFDVDGRKITIHQTYTILCVN